MDVVRVVQGLALAPDHGEGRGHVGSSAGVAELHLVTVDGVTQQLSVDTGHPALDVELTHEPGLDDELRDVVHLDSDAPLQATAHQHL